jgi:DNA-binding HxlR family transcriptional regulator
MRSYGQYCALAKALDIVGDRWTLLIVRELIVGASRYSDLKNGLPGIPTNLLAARLRHLEETGVVNRDEQGRYELTPWGQELAEPLNALARWASPLMDEMSATDTFQSSWLGFPIGYIFGGGREDRPECAVEIRTDDGPVTMESSNGKVRFHRGPADSPDLVLTGSPNVVMAILAGRIDEDEAEGLGAHTLGDFSLLSQLRRSDWLTIPQAVAVRTD